MKNIFSIIIVVCLFSLNANGQKNSEEISRWDKELIEEAPIWKNLLVHYWNADHDKYWLERKEALQDIVSHYSSSNWADDAELFLAGAKGTIEGDVTGAIKDLRAIIKDYPNATTFIDKWHPGIGFRINNAWMEWAPRLVSYDSERNIKGSRPLGSGNKLYTQELEALAYFNHLKDCPVLTKDIAQYTIAMLLLEQGDKFEAINELELLLDQSTKFDEITKRDKDASNGKNGYLIRSIPPLYLTPQDRTQYNAVVLLCELYFEDNKYKEALNLINDFTRESCADGWLWNYNLFCCDLYIRMNELEKAEEQLSIAEKGLSVLTKSNAERLKALYDEKVMPLPDDFVDWETSSEQQYNPAFIWIESLRQKMKDKF